MTPPDQSEPPVLNLHRGFEVYPMPVFAALETPDIHALAGWYQTALGFVAMFTMPGPDDVPLLIHLRRRKYQDLLIRPCPAAVPEGGGWSLCFQAGEDVDQLATRAAATPPVGRSQVGAATDTPWNTRQVRVTDPDGRILVFSQPRFDPELTERMRRYFEADKARP